MLPKNEVKYIQSLHHKKFREEYGVFITEGTKAVAELLKRQPGWIKKIYGTAEWKEVQPKSVWEVADFVQVEMYELEKISALQTPQQVLAVASIPENKYEPDDNWLLILDGIQDPGNIGTIIRTAHWFGIYQVVCSPDCVDAFSPKAVQAGMGSIFQVNVIYQDLVSFLAHYKQPVYGASLEGKSIFFVQQPLAGAIIIGSEGKGIRPEVLPFITQQITIPGAGDAESLNAAVAAGILMSWFRKA